MNKKEILKAISEEIEKGKSKQEIYKEFISKGISSSELIKYLAMVPNPKDEIKYKPLNTLLFSVLIFSAILKLIIAASLLRRISVLALPFAFLVPAITIWFAVSVWKFRGYIYRPLGLLGIAGILRGFSNIGKFSTYTPQQIMTQVILF